MLLSTWVLFHFLIIQTAEHDKMLSYYVITHLVKLSFGSSTPPPSTTPSCCTRLLLPSGCCQVLLLHICHPCLVPPPVPRPLHFAL